MLRCSHCSLSGRSDAELAALRECSYDPGGYFIVRGAPASTRTCLTARCLLAPEPESAADTDADADATHLNAGTERVILIQEQMASNRMLVDRDSHGCLFVTVVRFTLHSPSSTLLRATHTHTHTHTLTLTLTHTLSHTQTHAHSHTHTLSLSHTHTQKELCEHYTGAVRRATRRRS